MVSKDRLLVFRENDDDTSFMTRVSFCLGHTKGSNMRMLRCLE